MFVSFLRKNSRLLYKTCELKELNYWTEYIRDIDDYIDTQSNLSRLCNDVVFSFLNKSTSDDFKSHKFLIGREIGGYSERIEDLFQKDFGPTYGVKAKLLIKDCYLLSEDIFKAENLFRSELINKGYQLYNNWQLKIKTIDDFKSMKFSLDVAVYFFQIF